MCAPGAGGATAISRRAYESFHGIHVRVSRADADLKMNNEIPSSRERSPGYRLRRTRRSRDVVLGVFLRHAFKFELRRVEGSNKV